MLTARDGPNVFYRHALANVIGEHPNEASFFGIVGLTRAGLRQLPTSHRRETPLPLPKRAGPEQVGWLPSPATNLPFRRAIQTAAKLAASASRKSAHLLLPSRNCRRTRSF